MLPQDLFGLLFPLDLDDVVDVVPDVVLILPVGFEVLADYLEVLPRLSTDKAIVILEFIYKGMS